MNKNSRQILSYKIQKGQEYFDWHITQYKPALDGGYIKLVNPDTRRELEVHYDVKSRNWSATVGGHQISDWSPQRVIKKAITYFGYVPDTGIVPSFERNPAMSRENVARELLKLAKSLTAEKDPAEIVYGYLMSHSKKDVADFRKEVDKIDRELEDIRKQIEGLDKEGSGKIEAQSFLPRLIQALQPLKTMIENIEKNAKRLS